MSNIYTDYILFSIAGACAILSLLLLFYIVRSGKKSRIYRKVLEDDKSTFDPYTETLAYSQQATANQATMTLAATAKTKPETEETIALDHLEQATVALDHSELATVALETAAYSEERHATIAQAELAEIYAKYRIVEEIHGGGMSRVFLASHRKLGNQWIIKEIDKRQASLANEEKILKQLNHINLPQIIDIYENERKLFLVQRYIEGITLNKVLNVGKPIGQAMIIEWGEQLGQVLEYLHGLDSPIIHCDLKPSNIMVTHNNRLVLIDFGISRQQGMNMEQASGVTYRYAAPEQLKHKISPSYEALMAARFGELPPERMKWTMDNRTDIYSLGVILFELAVGTIPTVENRGLLSNVVSDNLAAIINKCLEIEPNKRYSSIQQFLKDLSEINNIKVSMAKTLLIRKVAIAALIVSCLSFGSAAAAGTFIFNQENGAVLTMSTGSVLLTQQQSAELVILKQRPSGKVEELDFSEVNWSYSNEGVARVEGKNIVGLNEGSTILHGKYRNKEIRLDVQVAQPLDGQVEVSLHYLDGAQVSVAAGDGERDWLDGSLLESSLVAPESISFSANGNAAFSDSGLLRVIENDAVTSVELEDFYLSPKLVRYDNDELYMLTHEWEDEDGISYGIFRITDKQAEPVYIAEAEMLQIIDFDFASNGELYYIEQNYGVNETYLNKLDARTGESISVLTLDNSATALTINPAGGIYIAYGEKGVIMHWAGEGTQLTYFAGLEGERHFIDGQSPRLYEPRKLELDGDDLYVLDFNVVRRIKLDNGVAQYIETIAGNVSTDLKASSIDGEGDEATFTPSSQTEISVVPSQLYDQTNTQIWITDPKSSQIRKIEFVK